MAKRPVFHYCAGFGVRISDLSAPPQASPRAPRPDCDYRRDDSTVVGMGDHMPDFLTRSFATTTSSGE
jgi:hypothetical protein